MMPTLSILDLRQHDVCHLDQEMCINEGHAGTPRVSDLEVRLGRSVREEEQIQISVWWSLPTTSIRDRFHSLKYFSAGRIIGIRAACIAVRRALRFLKEDDRRVCLAAVEASETLATELAETGLYADPVAVKAAVLATRTAEIQRAALSVAGKATSSAEMGVAFAAYASAHDYATSAGFVMLAFSFENDESEIENQRVDLDRLLAEAIAHPEAHP